MTVQAIRHRTVANRREVSATDTIDSRTTALFDRLRSNAAVEDRSARTIEESVKALREAGWLRAAMPSSFGGSRLGYGGVQAQRSVRSFIELAHANMSAARLFEGHANAIQLIDRYAARNVCDFAGQAVRNGALFGVWSADGVEPVRLSPSKGSLVGAKRFASGLGVVTHAVVTVGTGPCVQLCLVETSDPERQDRSTWTMAGMRASASGTYDLSGLTGDRFHLFGAERDYHREPGFIGGVWRIAAIQLGGTFGLLDVARQWLRSAGRLDAEPQIARLTNVLQRALGAIGLAEHAAEIAGGPVGERDPDRAVTLSIFARLLTEEIGQSAIAAVEQSVGLRHFDDASDTGRIARDLAVYMRQVARDSFQQRAGKTALSAPGTLPDLWYA